MSASPSADHRLTSARLDWDSAGMPVSAQFDDVYFSNDNGLAETRYVFLHHNAIPERWQTHDHRDFVIGETGFGTGLNFLAVWQSFRDWQATHPEARLQHLHFISVEKYPLTRADLAKALACWPELAPLSQQLVEHYPLSVPGCHRLLLDQGRVTLDLWFGDVHDSLPQMVCPPQGLVDAWFLDGFAPSKNPEMWSEALFAGLARLGRHGCTLATFTCAGFVRRGLQAAGFTMRKTPGHGRKREMLCGTLALERPLVTADETHTAAITVIGGGIAGACLALALVRRGRRVELYCADRTLADGASGNRQGALYPLLNHRHDELSRFYAVAFGQALRTYQALLAAPEVPSVGHDWCGVVQVAYDDKSQRKLQALALAGFPDQLVQALAPDDRDRRAGVALANDWNEQATLYYPQGGWVAPAELTQALYAAATATGLLRCHLNSPITAITETAQGWQLQRSGGEPLTTQTVVLANGAGLPALLPEEMRLPVYPVRGQVSHLSSCQPDPATQATLAALQTVLCFEGYLTPASTQGEHCLGASYGRNDTATELRPDEQTANLARLQRCLPTQAWVESLQVGDQGRVSLRAATRDHLPVVGELAPGYWVMGALGARGLCSAPLLGELLASALVGAPLPLGADLVSSLHPDRWR